MNKREALEQLVSELRAALPEIKGAVVASADGLPIVAQAEDAPRLAAMAATALGLGKRIAETTHLGPLAETVVRGRDGYVVVYAVGQRGVLALIAPAHVNLGLLHLEARAIAGRMAEVLG